MNVLILGADGKIARLVEKGIISDKAFADVKLTMFLRDKSRVDDLLSEQSIAVSGDVMDVRSLNAAMEDQDIVFDLTEIFNSLQGTKNIIESMQGNGVIRGISLNQLGALNKDSTIGLQRAEAYEKSELDYTFLRLATLNDNTEGSYTLMDKGKSIKGDTVSRQSVANIILQIIDDPAFLSKSNVGVSEPKLSGNIVVI